MPLTEGTNAAIKRRKKKKDLGLAMHARCLNINNDASIFVFIDLSSLVLALWLINKLFYCNSIIFSIVLMLCMQQIGPLYVLSFLYRRKCRIYQCYIDLNNPLKKTGILKIVLLGCLETNELPLSWCNNFVLPLWGLLSPQNPNNVLSYSSLVGFYQESSSSDFIDLTVISPR